MRQFSRSGNVLLWPPGSSQSVSSPMSPTLLIRNSRPRMARRSRVASSYLPMCQRIHIPRYALLPRGWLRLPRGQVRPRGPDRRSGGARPAGDPDHGDQRVDQPRPRTTPGRRRQEHHRTWPSGCLRDSAWSRGRHQVRQLYAHTGTCRRRRRRHPRHQRVVPTGHPRPDIVTLVWEERPGVAIQIVSAALAKSEVLKIAASLREQTK
jgi:hypothetical protein